MQTIEVFFYRPDIDHRLLDNIIAGWTSLFNRQAVKLGLICSHTEIGFGDNCWTSTMDGGQGVVCRPKTEVLKHPHRWFYFEFEIMDSLAVQLRYILDFAIANNAGYDKLAILSFFFPVRFGNQDKFICSEFVYRILYRIAQLADDNHPIKKAVRKENEIPSPIRLAYWLKTAGLEVKTLI